MKLQMLNSFTNFLEKSVNRVINLVAALPDLPDLNYISHSVQRPKVHFWKDLTPVVNILPAQENDRTLRCFLLDQNTPILHHTETN